MASRTRLTVPAAVAAVVVGLLCAVDLLGPGTDPPERGFSTTAAPVVGQEVPVAADPSSLSAYSANTAPDLSSATTVVDGSAFRSAIWPNFQKYVAGCMKRKGFTYSTGPRYTASYPPPTKLQSAVSAGDTVSSVVDPAVSEMAPAAAPSSSTVTNANYLAALRGDSAATTGTDYRAYDGVNTVNDQARAGVSGGCELEGRQAVTYPAMAAATRVNADLQPVLEATFFTQQAQTADAAWSSCMKSRGYTYASYLDPPALFRVRADVLKDSGGTSSAWTTLRAQEAATNTASVACASSSGVTTFIAERVQPAWSAFRSAHVTDLNQAGGMTYARGDLL